jgi:NDP-sugar pyrophosphorylase family protein
MSDIAVVYMVAGISSRFGGKIKQFAKVGPEGETLIEYSLKQALTAGFTKIIFIVGNKTEKPFKEMFGDSYDGIPIYYALQSYDPSERDRPWGTVDAVCAAKDLIDCPFVVCNGDDIYGENTFKTMVGHIRESSECASIGYKLIDVLPDGGGNHNRGIFVVDESGYVKDLKENFGILKSDLGASGFNENSPCSTNFFSLGSEVVGFLNEKLEKFKAENTSDRNVECLLPDELSNLIKEGKIVMKLYETPDKWIGVTNPEDEEIVREKLKSNSF